MTLQRTFQRAALCCALAIFTLLPARRSQAAPITGFGDIDYWVGSGTNQAALVIDWNDGIAPVSLAWGFQWDGVATGQDMLQAIAGATLGDVTATGADLRLNIYITSYGFGDALDRIVYNGSGYTHDSAGFLSGGYWEYSIFGGDFEYQNFGDPTIYTYDLAGSPDYPNAWFASPIGFGSRELVDGSWDGWSFAPDFTPQPIDQPVAAAVPEPGTLILTAFAGGLLALRRRLRSNS